MPWPLPFFEGSSVLRRAPPDATFVRLSLLLDTVIGGVSLRVPDVVVGDTDETIVTLSSVVGGRIGRLRDSTLPGGGCRNDVDI